MEHGYVTCPYNPQHRMPKLRLQYHIVKCQRNYITAGMKPCPYNATHIIAEDKYRQHIQSCLDSVLIEGHKYDGINKVHGKLNEGAFHYDIVRDESWELQETDNSSSQLSENIENKDNCQYLDILDEYDEDEEPLQRLLHEEKKMERVSANAASGSALRREQNISDSQIHSNGCQRERSLSPELFTHRSGAGRGRIISLLASMDK